MEAAALALSAFLSVEVVAAAVAAVDGRLGSLRLSHSVGNPTKTDDQTTSHSWSWGHMLMEQAEEICMTSTVACQLWSGKAHPVNRVQR